jgi:hypothetical protein
MLMVFVAVVNYGVHGLNFFTLLVDSQAGQNGLDLPHGSSFVPGEYLTMFHYFGADTKCRGRSQEMCVIV